MNCVKFSVSSRDLPRVRTAVSAALKEVCASNGVDSPAKLGVTFSFFVEEKSLMIYSSSELSVSFGTYSSDSPLCGCRALVISSPTSRFFAVIPLKNCTVRFASAF